MNSLKTTACLTLVGLATIGLADRINQAKAVPIQNQIKTLTADINNDGIVDEEDRLILMSQYKDEEQWYQENTVEVYTGQELTDPDTIYFLQSDIKSSGNCFTSNIGEVTINLNGYSIEGDGTGEAIVFHNESGIENVFIGNGTIKNFSSAINLKGANNSMLQGLDVSDNKGDYSIILENCPNILLSKIKCIDNDKSGLLIKNCYGNNEITDSAFSNNSLFDIKLVNSKENIVLNCDYNPDKESVDTNSSLIRKSPYRAYVQDSSGPVFNAKVSAYDVRDDLEGMVRTGAKGYTPSISLTNYINEDGTIIPFGPYIIIAEKGPLTDSHIYDPNVFNLEDIFTFGEIDNGVAERANETEAELQNPIKTLEGDLNNDGIVNHRDIGIMSREWLQEEPWYGENRILVYDCQELTEPNAIYVLQNHIKTSGTCFTSRVSGVILELNYLDIEGDGTGQGVVFHNKSGDIENISIRYGDIKNFNSAISLKGVNNSILKHLNLSVSGNYGDPAIILENCSNLSLSEARCVSSGLLMKDCYGNNEIIDSSFQGLIELVNSKENIFLDCIIFGESVDENSSLVRANSYRAYVEDSSGEPVFNAKVSAYDVRDGIESTVTTEPNGYTPPIWMINYINEDEITTPYGPYTITAEKGPLRDSHIFDPNVDNKGEDSFTLRETANGED